jgi:hypothetical protein
MPPANERTFRALGGVDRGSPPPQGAAADALRAEFDRALTLAQSLREEGGVSPTGRRSTAADEAKLRTLTASVEGASRFAIRLGLLTAAQVRALWVEAMGRGLFDGWDAGQSAYGHAAAAAATADEPPLPVGGAAPEGTGRQPAVRQVKEPRLGAEG